MSGRSVAAKAASANFLASAARILDANSGGNLFRYSSRSGVPGVNQASAIITPMKQKLRLPHLML